MRGNSKLLARKNRMGYVFTLPFILGLALIFIPTVISSAVYSFGDVSINFNNVSTKIMGWKNYYNAFFVDVSYRQHLLNAVQGMILNTIIILLFSFFIANLLNQKFIGKGIARAVFFLPVILSTGIIANSDASNIVTSLFSSDANTASSVAAAFSGSGFSSFFNLKNIISSINISPTLTQTVLYAIDNTYSIVNSSGVQILIFISALQSISPSIFEAAKVEGATKWEEFWKITFPILTPMILVSIVYTIIDTFTNPAYKILSYIQDCAFVQNKLGYASALSWIYFVVVIAILGLVFGLVSKRIQYMD